MKFTNYLGRKSHEKEILRLHIGNGAYFMRSIFFKTLFGWERLDLNFEGSTGSFSPFPPVRRIKILNIYGVGHLAEDDPLPLPLPLPRLNLYQTKEVDPSVENEDIGENQDNFVSELANSIPGIDEAMSFAEMLKLVQTMDYSVIVFDTAPTGHTLRLLQFPSTLEKGLTKLMTLKNKFGGLLSQMTRMFGVEDELGEDAILGRLEGMKDVIEQVNQQFRDPDLTTFVCVCIPEFLSLYETERLVQELAKFEIDTHNIIINQVLFDDEVVDCKLLKARMRMQERYIDQFYTLYEDFNISKLPLMPEEVTGLQALKSFSRHFFTPYQPAIKRGTVEELEMRIAELNRQLKGAEDELDKLRKGKQKA